MIASLSTASTGSSFSLDGQIAQDDFPALSELLVKALLGAANVERPSVPASLDAAFMVAALAPGNVRIGAWVERATRTLIFVAAEAQSASGVRLAVASGVFKVRG